MLPAQTIAASMPAPIAMYRGGGFSVGERPISVPILFIAGSADRCTLPEMSLDQEHWLRGEYRREVWPDVGHYPHLERPRLALERAADWFAAR